MTQRRLERARSARLIRDSICLLSSKWSVDLLLALGDGTRRYHELLEDLAPISEKVLTQTLRAMPNSHGAAEPPASSRNRRAAYHAAANVSAVRSSAAGSELVWRRNHARIHAA